MQTVSLNGKWTLLWNKEKDFDLSAPKNSCPAAVPGNAELDLAAAGFLPTDLYFGMNITALKELEDCTFCYTKNFDHPGFKGSAILHFSGVDCLAEYYLNGEKFGESDNSFIEYEFDITGLLKPHNTLAVVLHSPILAAYQETPDAFMTRNTVPLNHDSVFVRKPPHEFGWDIMPRAVTFGLYKDVYLYEKPAFSVTEVAFDVLKLTADAAELDFSVMTDLGFEQIKSGSRVEITGTCGESKFTVTEKLYYKDALVRVKIPSPKVWWPRDYGDQNLYGVTVTIFVGNEIVASETLKIGIRTVELVRTEVTDGQNGKFEFLINGRRIICKGTNWVPLDAFHSQDKDRYEKALDLLYDIGCNMVRCWGGNLYPEDCFFDFCDEHGILIWQDFAMACHAYPQGEKFCKTLSEEAAFIIKKFRNHPSLVLWAGDNEVDAILYQNHTLPSLNILTRKVLPEAVKLNDYNRPYLPSSPYICDELAEAQRDDLLPEFHLWGPRDYFKSSFYTTAKAHFFSETGYHGCPGKKSLEKFISPEKLWPYTNNSEWNLHSSDQRDNDYRVLLMEKQIRQLFGEVPDNLDDYTFASQVSQAEAKKFFIENVRTQKPVKTGILWWNLLDGWPQMSDAVVDWYFEKKLAYDYIKRSQAPFCVMIGAMENWHLPVIAVNDTLKPLSGEVRVCGENGKPLFEREFALPADGYSVLERIPAMYSDKALFLIEWRTENGRGSNHFVTGAPPLSLNQYKDWYEKITAFSSLK
ncbi:MAG TPA: glycoside hydrolase family 2 TIM barrel-domain containing protein [Oscillospiraceae bacterium]|nr:glycoside hydrolase family 2 TIM barrel-domain containing protein [Oscillospiraceae bacterium]HPF55774.1 glycoside hydrolase family 2 TIM barrel-domain containing protein [Clostridiales bacterium]HPK35845.1 glycoside hydrolase family 2 TIM barrel-domain containing protein [Oscillospiraceae bacterium]HPR76010.1 glycoside hydrolase family 2 TIM barrel-domain containing protein [Oscillospiraceae bacterium]